MEGLWTTLKSCGPWNLKLYTKIVVGTSNLWCLPELKHFQILENAELLVEQTVKSGIKVETIASKYTNPNYSRPFVFHFHTYCPYCHEVPLGTPLPCENALPQVAGWFLNPGLTRIISLVPNDSCLLFKGLLILPAVFCLFIQKGFIDIFLSSQIKQHVFLRLWKGYVGCIYPTQLF